MLRPGVPKVANTDNREPVRTFRTLSSANAWTQANLGRGAHPHPNGGTRNDIPRWMVTPTEEPVTMKIQYDTWEGPRTGWVLTTEYTTQMLGQPWQLRFWKRVWGRLIEGPEYTGGYN